MPQRQTAQPVEEAALGMVSRRFTMQSGPPSRGLKALKGASAAAAVCIASQCRPGSPWRNPRQRGEGDQGRLHLSCCCFGPAPSLLAGAPQAAGGDLAGLSVLRVDSAGQLRADCALLERMTHGRGHLPLRGQPAQLQRGQLGLAGAPRPGACTSQQSRVLILSRCTVLHRGEAATHRWSGPTSQELRC